MHPPKSNLHLPQSNLDLPGSNLDRLMGWRMLNGGSQHLPVVVEDFAENGEWRTGAAVGGGGGGGGGK